ncbi:hypothetical protein CHARACLAT_016208 [Characodon lateralis]|uniref:Uncharacterized protein n=1 Tax=Characodon lateralis TaxID=208331 RepID=A0ABU7DRJ0_9TELE|nr:hypothetical protein [Characodon lateralis]
MCTDGFQTTHLYSMLVKWLLRYILGVLGQPWDSTTTNLNTHTELKPGKSSESQNAVLTHPTAQLPGKRKHSWNPCGIIDLQNYMHSSITSFFTRGNAMGRHMRECLNLASRVRDYI